MVSTDDLAWTYHFHHDGLCDRPRMLLQNIHNHACSILTQTTLQILTTVSTLNSVPNIIKELKCWRKCHIGKLNYRRAVCIFTQYLISHTFPTNCTLFYVTSQKPEETNHFQYKYTFYDQHHVCWISNFYYNCTTRKRNSWLWNKTAYMAMER
jgi:hypothetical protein